MRLGHSGRPLYGRGGLASLAQAGARLTLMVSKVCIVTFGVDGGLAMDGMPKGAFLERLAGPVALALARSAEQSQGGDPMV